MRKENNPGRLVREELGGKKRISWNYRRAPDNRGNLVGLKRQPVILLGTSGMTGESNLKGHVSVYRGAVSTRSVCSYLQSTGTHLKTKTWTETAFFLRD